MKYCLTRTNKFFDELGQVIVYGIRGTECDGAAVNETLIEDVSDDEQFVCRVVALLNREDVSICHMEDVVLDCINLLVNDENYDIIKL